MKIIIALLLITLLGACSTRSWYEAGRNTAIQRCNTQPAAEYERCMSDVNTQRYDDYEKARKATPAQQGN